MFALVVGALGAPIAAFLFLGSFAAAGRPRSEEVVRRIMVVVLTLSFLLLVGALLVALAVPPRDHVISLGRWFSAGASSFAVLLHFDRIALAFAAFTVAICGIVSSFSNRYLHREAGYHRYFMTFLLFVVGIQLVALAGSIELLFTGWELLGLSSALLVSFFHDRPAPARHALYVFTVYRIGDVDLLGAVVLLHAGGRGGDLELLFAGDAVASVSSSSATAVGALLLVAVAAKSALLPFSSWLPRAMEGPTPSSAVYYGALSTHAGVFLLLRAAPLFEQSPVVRVAAALVGAATAVLAGLTARVQTDIKSTLAYASLTQIGVMVVEITLGLHMLAFVHMVGHMALRLLQFLAAPNVLHDLHDLGPVAGAAGGRRRALARRWSPWAYLLALERGFLDTFIERVVVGPFLAAARGLDRLDRILVGGTEDEGRGDGRA